MKKLMYSALALALMFAAAPTVFGQPNVTSVQSAGNFITDLITNVAVPVIFALAFIVFIWGIFKYFIVGGHDDDARKSGKQLMLWGILGFFIMVSVWGLVNILVGSVRLDNQGPSQLPRAVEPGVR